MWTVVWLLSILTCVCLELQQLERDWHLPNDLFWGYAGLVPYDHALLRQASSLLRRLPAMDCKQFKEEYIMVTTFLNLHPVQAKLNWQIQRLQLCYRQQWESLCFLPCLGDVEMCCVTVCWTWAWHVYRNTVMLCCPWWCPRSPRAFTMSMRWWTSSTWHMTS